MTTTLSTRMAGRLTLMAALAGLALSAAAHEPGDDVPQQYIVQLRPGKDISKVLNPADGFVKASYLSRDLYLLESYPDHEIEVELENDDRVASAIRNQFNAITDGHTQSFFVSSMVPTDYSDQPASAITGIGPAHAFSSGAGMMIAVLDTGIGAHPELAGCIAPGFNWLDSAGFNDDSGDGIDNNGNGFVDEMVGHGTFVAGLIHMVAPGATILPIKVLDSDGQGTSFALAAGIYQAIDAGAGVINISLSTPVQSFAVSEAIAEATSRGIVVVSCVGNANSDVLSYPAADAGVISVAGTDWSDQKAWFSDFGGTVSIAAPATGILSLIPDGGYAIASGTSFSAALVSGAAGLVKSSMPWLSAEGVRLRLVVPSTNINARNPLYIGALGRGRLSVIGTARTLGGRRIATPVQETLTATAIRK